MKVVCLPIKKVNDSCSTTSRKCTGMNSQILKQRPWIGSIQSSRMKHQQHEGHRNRTCVLAGDFNIREGEDSCLLSAGWRDAKFQVDSTRSCGSQQEWTWKGRGYTARYDRVYLRSPGEVQPQCVFYHVHDALIEGRLSDHGAVCVELRCHQPAPLQERPTVQFD